MIENETEVRPWDVACSNFEVTINGEKLSLDGTGISYSRSTNESLIIAFPEGGYGFESSWKVRWLYPLQGASIFVLRRRAEYKGRKGRRALRRLAELGVSLR